MKDDLQNRIKGYGYIAENIEIEYNVNENKNYESIKKISFEITNEIDNKDIEVVKTVNIQNTDTQENEYKISEQNKNEIIEKLSSTYEINKENIHIM